MKRSLCMLAPLAAMIAAPGACRRAELSGPPELRIGRDPCAECGMLLGEDRCAAALLVQADGDREHLVFDDIACMLDHRRTNPALPVLSACVRDYSARDWISADSAWYLQGRDGSPATPMASGIVAFASRAAADQQLALTPGRVLDAAAIAESRVPPPEDAAEAR